MNIIREREAGEPKILPNGDLTIHAEGKIGAMVQYPVLVDQGSGYVAKTFEKFVRPPGTRIIALNERNEVYLQKEARIEKNGAFDWRLPGGKVFDSFDVFQPHMFAPIDIAIAQAAAERELHEEAELQAGEWEYLQTIPCGATVQWDLLYFVARDIQEASHDHDEGEHIEDGAWYSYDQVEAMCKSGEIGEGRTVSVLLQYIQQHRSVLYLYAKSESWGIHVTARLC